LILTIPLREAEYETAKTARETGEATNGVHTLPLCEGNCPPGSNLAAENVEAGTTAAAPV